MHRRSRVSARDKLRSVIRIDRVVHAGVEGRSRVHDLVTHDLDRAVREARQIEHPWYRCQSLARVAEEVRSNENAAKLLGEALAAAHAQTEPNRIVSVASWPVGVMIRRDVAGVDAEVAKLLAIIAPEPNPIRKADALMLLFYAVFPRKPLRDEVLHRLLDTLHSARGWKARRLLQFTAEKMLDVSVEEAERICALIPPGKEANRARRAVTKSQSPPLIVQEETWTHD